MITIFQAARLLALAQASEEAMALRDRNELAPIEQTPDGWYCLRPDAAVVHYRTATGEFEDVGAQLAAALIGSASRRLPIFTWFLPRGPALVCGSCDGAGIPKQVPRGLGEKVSCRCGGLGWIPGQ